MFEHYKNTYREIWDGLRFFFTLLACMSLAFLTVGAILFVLWALHGS
jgi:hypothetical protein